MKLLKAIRDFKAWRKANKELALKTNQLYFENHLCKDVLQQMVDQVDRKPGVCIDVKLMSGEVIRISSPVYNNAEPSSVSFYRSLNEKF